MMLTGRPMSLLGLRIASTASPSEAPGARLNEIVAAGTGRDGRSAAARSAARRCAIGRQRHLAAADEEVEDGR
jgi:type IV secretory pathway TrbL component